MKLRAAPATKTFLESIARSQPHALLLTGPVGIGLATLARHIAAMNGRVLVEVRPESKSTALPSISAERIRQLYDETRTKMNGTYFVIIDDADTMNHVAQNSLLKLLEEPNDSIHFILTSHTPDRLLPTIRSRAQAFALPPLDALESSRLLKSLGVSDALTQQRLLYVAQGLPAELSRLTAKESDFKALSERVQVARQVIEGTAYQRLVVAASFGGDRQQAIAFIDMLTLLMRRSLTLTPDVSTVQRIERLIGAAEAIKANGSIKLHLSTAVI